MKTSRIISSALAAAMLAGGTALPASAENVQNDNIFTASTFSETGALSKPKITGASTGARTIKLKWGRVKGASGYKIYRKTKTGKYKCVNTVKGGDVTAVKLGGFNSDTKYTFRIRAFKKSDGRTAFSQYSADKSFRTRYGLGDSNFTSEAFSVKFDKKLWDLEEGSFYLSDNGVRFGYKSTKDDTFDWLFSYDVGGSITFENWKGRSKGKSLKYFAEDFANEEKAMYDPTYYKITYGKAFGERAAFIWEVDDDPDINPDPTVLDHSPIIMIYENNVLYYISSYYPEDSKKADKYKAALDKVFDTVKLTYKNF